MSITVVTLDREFPLCKKCVSTPGRGPYLCKKCVSAMVETLSVKKECQHPYGGHYLCKKCVSTPGGGPYLYRKCVGTL